MSKNRVITGRITSGFGLRVHPITGKESGHNGVDIAAPVGTPIYSPIDGVVTMRNTHATGGLQLAIENRNTGIRVGFAHLSEQVATMGQKITKGQVVAKSGNTGASTGPHLHYTYAVNGQKIDPTPYITFD